MGTGDLLTPRDPVELRARVMRRALQIERRRRVVRGLLAAPALVAAVLLGVVVAQRPGSHAEVAAGPAGAVTTENVAVDLRQPWSVINASDGALWVLGHGDAASVVRIARDGTRQTYPLPDGASPDALVAGTDEAVWATDTAMSRVIRVAREGSITTWPTDGAPSSSATWLGGRFWFAEPGLDRITGINREGDVVHLEVPRGRAPTAVTTGPDGAIWFASSTMPIVGSVAPSGAVNELTLAGDARATALTTGPGPSLWLVLSSADGPRVAHVDGRARVIEESRLGVTAVPSISLGPDGRLWYAPGTSAVQLQSAAKLTVLDLGRPLRADAWALRDDDSMWAVDRSARQVVRITLG